MLVAEGAEARPSVRGAAPARRLRVLGICQRRGAQVLAMTYAHPRLELAISADERHLQLLRGRLENAIDVLTVDYAP